MALDSPTVRLLQEWLADIKSQARSTREADLLASVRKRTHHEAALTALERVASRHTDRLDRLEQVLAVVVEQVLQSEPVPLEAPNASPYRDGAAKSPPAGSFACRRCGVVLPDSQACASADGRFCLQCFEP